jgi:hypothetical protein
VARSTWTEEETATLLAEHDAGTPRREIARRLERPKSTIDYRLATLGIRTAPRNEGVADRFWTQVDCRGSDECWEWLGYRDRDGYGSVSMWPTRMGAHRVAYEIVNGAVPDGLAVRHRCDNQPCCNPAHLELGTIIDNNRDKTARGRDAKGERHGMARYSAEQIEHVKRLIAGGLTSPAIEAETGVRRATVLKVMGGKQWKEVVRR